MKRFAAILATALVAGACSSGSGAQGGASPTPTYTPDPTPTPTAPSGESSCETGKSWAQLNSIDLTDASVSDAEILSILEASVSDFLASRAVGRKFIPRIDRLQTRIQMMDTWGGEFGYNLFDRRWANGAYDKYASALNAFDALGGQRRLDALAAMDSALMTSVELSDLEKLKSAKVAVSNARYLDLVVRLKYRLSTSLDREERAQGLLAEQEFATFSSTNRVALDAAVAAGKKATKEQMALLTQEKTLQAAMYKTGNVALKVGDAIAALKAEGVDVPKYRLPSDAKLQQKLLGIQSRFEVMADTMPEPGDLAWFVSVCRP